MATTPEIEYFYSAHSAYAYLGSATLRAIAAEVGARIVHRPYTLSPVVEALGAVPFAKRSRAHVDYFFGRELVRWAEWRDAPIIAHRPTYHDNPLTLPNGLLIAAQDACADVDALSHAILEAHWRDDADIADRDVLAGLCRTCGLEAEALLDAAMSGDVQARHDANTSEAQARAVFGSPTYFVGGDMFYGQDRLEMVARALRRPFAARDFVNP